MTLSERAKSDLKFVSGAICRAFELKIYSNMGLYKDKNNDHKISLLFKKPSLISKLETRALIFGKSVDFYACYQS